MFGYAYAWFHQPGHPDVPGAAFLLAAGLHAGALALAAAAMAHFKTPAQAAA